jgi:hypothetical protein
MFVDARTNARVQVDTEHIIIIVTEEGGRKPKETMFIKFRLCCHPVWVSRILVLLPSTT